MLSNKFKLSKLNLNNNPLSDDGFIKIAQGLTEIDTLRIITVANTKITKSSIPTLSDSLQNKRFLTKLLLDNNDIGQEGAQVLA